MADLLMSARADYRAKRFDKAAESYKRLAEEDPENPIGYWGWANSLTQLGQYDEAIRVCQEGLRLNKNDVKFRGLLGTIYGLQTRYDASEIEFRQAIEQQPDFADTYIGYGVLLLDQDKLVEAEAAFKKAVELNPKNEMAVTDLAIVLSRQGRRSEAAALARRAFLLNPAPRTALDTIRSFNDAHPLALAVVTTVLVLILYTVGWFFIWPIAIILIVLMAGMTFETFRMNERLNAAVYFLIACAILALYRFGAR